MIRIKNFKDSFDATKIEKSLYEYNGSPIDRAVTSYGAILDIQTKELLENLCLEYSNELSISGAPIRMDLGLDSNLKLVPFEINTGFVDQFGAGINLLEAVCTKNFETSLRALGSMQDRDNVLLMQKEYKNEMDLMNKYIKQATGKGMKNICLDKALLTDDSTFCYGYPVSDITSQTSIVPNIDLLNIESKSRFYNFLDRSEKYNEILKIPNWYSIENTPYDEIPRDRYMFFKKDGPKIKGDRNTVSKTKIRNKESMINRYSSGEYIAQEVFDPYILEETGGTVELRSLFLGNTEKYSMIVSYILLGDDPEKGKLVNDSCPQGAVLVS